MAYSGDWRENLAVRPSVSATKDTVIQIRDRRRKHPYTALLLSELVLILIYPFLANTGYHEEIFRLLALVVFSTSLYTLLGAGASPPWP